MTGQKSERWLISLANQLCGADIVTVTHDQSTYDIGERERGRRQRSQKKKVVIGLTIAWHYDMAWLGRTGGGIGMA